MNSSISWLGASVTGAALLASSASAQSIYVDLGSAPIPSSSYAAAAGVPGYWNSFSSGTQDAPPFIPVLDIGGNSTGASVRTSWCSYGDGDVPSTSGDDEALLDDWFYTDCYWNFPEHPTVEVAGLAGGTYQLFVYHQGWGGAAKDLDLYLSSGTIEGDPITLPAVGVFPGTFANWPIGVALLHVDPSGGNLRMDLGYTNGGLAGFQLLRLDDTTSFCSGDLGRCPCSNVGAPLSGCPSSFSSSGAPLVGTGNAQVSNDTLQLTATNAGISLVILMQGTTPQNLGQGTLYGDGLRCVGGQLVRMAWRQAVGGVFQYPIAGDPPISVRGGVPATGGFRSYQLRYRNAASYCTPETFNATNGIAVEWLP